MACNVGSGILTFGSLTGKFRSADGFNIDGKSVPAVDCTADDDTSKNWAAGNMPDFGQLSGTLLVEAGSIEELNTLIGTSATLLISFNIDDGSSNTTKATITGSAIWLEGPITTIENDAATAACVFQWASAPTYSNEAA